jgi:hypothetical protein
MTRMVRNMIASDSCRMSSSETTREQPQIDLAQSCYVGSDGLHKMTPLNCKGTFFFVTGSMPRMKKGKAVGAVLE